MSTFGSLPFAFLALPSYNFRASRRIEKSSSGVQDVLDTRSAGRSGRSVGLGLVDADCICVKGVEYGAFEAGRNASKDGVDNAV